MKKHIFNLGTLVCLPFIAFAQNKETETDTTLKLINLKEIVFSANKTEEDKADVAYTIDVIKAKQIELSNAQTSADVLSNTGNIMVQKSQAGGGSPIIRGFEASRVLIVIDGVRLNNAVYRTGHLQNVITIDNAIIDRTEVIYGPSSVIYGSDALGGVMHFYTKTPLLGIDSMNFKLNSYARYSSANQEKTGHVDFNLGFKKIASLTSITYSDFDDLRTGYSRTPNPDFGRCYFYAGRNYNNTGDSMIRNSNPNIQKFSGYSQLDLMEKLIYKIDDNKNIGLNIQYSTSSNINRYDRLSETQSGVLRFAEWYYGPQNRFLASLHTTIRSDNSKIYDNLRITTAFQNIDESRINRRFNSNNKRYQIENIKVYSVNADFRKLLKEKHELSYGIEFLYNDVTSKAKSVNISDNTESPWSTRYPDGGSSMMTGAVYLTHTWEINDKLILTDGIRYSNNTLKANFNDTLFYPFPFKNTTQKNDALNGNLGLVISPEEYVRFSILGSTGYRSPNIDDLTKIFESTGGNLIVPNEKLKPEYAYNGEVGFEVKAFNNQLKIEGNYYYTILKNAIVTKNASINGQDSIVYNGVLSRVQSQQNADKATVQGVYGAITSDLNDHVSFKSSLTYTLGNYFQKVPETNSIPEHDTIIPLDHIPPMFGQTSVFFRFKKFESEVYARYSAPKLLKDYSPSGEDNLSQATPDGMPGWVTFNIKTSYKINNHFSANVGIENLFDTHYRVFASGISSPGRNIFVTLRAKI
ncbi:MAG: TonB-dependent receptor [Bacteroidia bacterium]|nr:TonB-dependent receptor [Bacteroidia bacterium]